ncbi:MAG: metal ABC transporter substrate-binding protein [Deltaproteobacteria bacterium]|nr:metal ABC transporter substrate-binding protein [Deltaproteobacteria bacterium]
MAVITRILLLFLVLCLAGSAIEARAEKKVKVIASFSILGDMVGNVGGDRVEVTTLVGPNGDAHVYQPTPAAAKAVGGANLVVVNGLGFEGWMDRLIQTSGYKGPIVVASRGIKPREMTTEEAEEHEQGAKHEHKIDPHAWQNLSNGLIYVENIAKGLSSADPDGAAIYKANTDAYEAKLADLDRWVKAEFAGIPKPKRRMITSHDALGYFGAAYGITILSSMGVSTESEPSAGGIARLIKQIRQEKITAVFIENVTDPRLMEQVAKESGVKLGGELYSDALSKQDESAPTYIKMFENNATKIIAAMRQGP